MAISQPKAAEDGFDLRSSEVGQAWSRDVLKDPELRREYQSIGKSFKRQREFRAMWAKKKFEALSERQSFEEKSLDVERAKSEYQNWQQLLDKAKSRRGALNYWKECMAKFANKEKFGGKEWVAYDNMMKMTVVLWVHRSHLQDVSKAHINQKKGATMRVPDQPGSEVKQEEPAPPVRSSKRTMPESPAKVEPGNLPSPPVKKGKSCSEVPTDAKEFSKYMNSKFTKLKGLKVRLDACQSQLCEVQTAMTSQREWQWAQVESSEFASLKAAVDQSKAKSAFWTSWGLSQANLFQQQAKKTHRSEDVLKELDHLAEVETIIGKLEKHLAMVFRVHRARMDVQ